MNRLIHMLLLFIIAGVVYGADVLEIDSEKGRMNTCKLKLEVNESGDSKAKPNLSSTCIKIIDGIKSVTDHCPDEENLYKKIKISVAVPDGVYYAIAADLDTIFNSECMELERVTTAGSVDICDGVAHEEDVVFGLVQSDLPYYSDCYKHLRVVTGIHKEQIHVIARPGIDSWDDIVNAYIGKPESGTYNTVKRLLKRLDNESIFVVDKPNDDFIIVLEEFKYHSRGSEKAEVDAIFYVSGSPSDVLDSMPKGFKLISIPESENIINDEESSLVPLDIPEDAYDWNSEPIETYGVTALLVTYDWKSITSRETQEKYSERCAQVQRANKILTTGKIRDFFRENGEAGNVNKNWRTFIGDPQINVLWEESDCRS